MPKRRKVDISDSCITLGGTSLHIVGTEAGTSSIRSGRVAIRKTEIAAEENTYVRTLSDLDMELIWLERVAAQPSLYPEVKGRPIRAIGGTTAHEWIGARVGMGAKQVAARLEEITELLEQSAKAISW